MVSTYEVLATPVRLDMDQEVALMPRGDGTGPMDRGPMTGRGAGFCVSATEVPAARSFFGRGLRRGAGRGRDMQIEALAAELGQVKQQLKELDSDKS